MSKLCGYRVRGTPHTCTIERGHAGPHHCQAVDADMRSLQKAVTDAEAAFFDALQHRYPVGLVLSAQLQSNHDKPSRVRVERVLCISGRVGHLQVRVLPGGHRTAIHWTQIREER